MTATELVDLRNKVFLDFGIPALVANGFKQSPFSTDCYGKDNLRGYTYALWRLRNNLLENVTVHISFGDRWIQVFLNIFEPGPTPKALSDFRHSESVKYYNPPTSLTKMRLNIDDHKGIPLFNFRSTRHKLGSGISKSVSTKAIQRLQENIRTDLSNIDDYAGHWFQLHVPLKVDWNGRLYEIDSMTIEERLEAVALKKRLSRDCRKNPEEAARILKWLDVKDEEIQAYLNRAV